MMRALTTAVLRRHPLPQPSKTTNKNERGRVLVVGSSAGVPGAALLVAEAVLRAGAGKVQIAAPRSVAVGLGIRMPEAGILALDEGRTGDPTPRASTVLREAVAGADAVVVGPGHKGAASSATLALKLLELPSPATFVIDAAAATALWKHRARVKAAERPLIVTPHAGEMATMLGTEVSEIEKSPERFAALVAGELRCVVVLKNADTHIATPGGECWLHQGGVVGLATSGSGDVLAGLAAGFAARGADPVRAALWAVYTHGKAGRRLSRTVGPLGFLAKELLREIPAVLREA